VYLGSDAFDHLTGLNQILQAKHSRISPYEGEMRLDILRKLDIKIAENGPSIEDSELFPQDYRNSPKNRDSQHQDTQNAQSNPQSSPQLSKNTAYGVLNDTNTFEGVYIPSVYRRNMKDVKMFTEYMTYRPDFSLAEFKNKPLPTPLLIITYYRAGSSFFSQIFNQHPDVFYQFEPIFPYGRDCETHIQDKIRTLEKLTRCSFSDSLNWSHKYKTEKLRNSNEFSYNDKACISYGACFRTNSKSLCSEELCPQPSGQVGKLPCGYCGQLNLYKTGEVCRRKKVHAIKIIRICEVKWLLELIKKNSELKIIHLVRDPRGLLSSRLKLHAKDGDFDAMKNITEECKNQVKSHEFSVELQKVQEGAKEDFEQENLRKFFRNNYLEVRYEDTAIDPKGVANDILDFIGLESHENVDKWIEKQIGKGQEKNSENLDFAGNQVNSVSNVNSDSLQNLLKSQNSQSKHVVGYGPSSRKARSVDSDREPVLKKSTEYQDRTVMEYVWKDNGEAAYNRTIIKADANQQKAQSLPLLQNPNSNSKNYNTFRKSKINSPKAGSIAYQKRRNPFGTVRANSTHAALAWRKVLPLEMARLVEQSVECSKMMTQFGYKQLPVDLTVERYKDLVDNPIEVF